MAVFSVTEAMVAWLSSMGYPTSTRVQRSAPERFVTVERVGGGPSSMVDRAEMAVQCWAATDAEAEEFACAVRNRVLVEPPPAGVHSVRVETGPYQFYDEQTGRARYQMVLAATCQLET